MLKRKDIPIFAPGALVMDMARHAHEDAVMSGAIYVLSRRMHCADSAIWLPWAIDVVAGTAILPAFLLVISSRTRREQGSNQSRSDLSAAYRPSPAVTTTTPSNTIWEPHK